MGNSLLSGIGSAIGAIGNISAIGKKAPVPTNAPFKRPFTTPAYRFGGGKLTRTDTGEGSLLNRERTAFDAISALNPELAALIQRSAAAGGALGNLSAQAQGLRGPTGDLISRTQGIEGELGALQGEVKPGMGRLTEAAVNTIRNRGAEALGGLQSQLQRRGIRGASFANDQESRLSMDVAQQEEQARSQALINEVQLSTDIASRRLAANELAGNLVKLDAANIALQGEIIAKQMGVTDQMAQIVGQKMQAIQLLQQQLRDQASRELQELGIAADFLSQVDQLLEAGAQNQIGNIINQMGGQGGSNPNGTGGTNDQSGFDQFQWGESGEPWVSDYSWGNLNNLFGGGVNMGGPSPNVTPATPNTFGNPYLGY